MKNITFVTGNKNKVKEVEQILQVKVEVADIDIDEIQGLGLEKIALHKLDKAFEKIKRPVIVDDVSVNIHAWNNFPGPLIKWVLQSSNGTPEMLLKMLHGEEDRKATAILAIGYRDENVRKIFYGEISGTIGYTIEGENGFGWDKVFIPDGYTKTLASMPIDEKNSISHRRRALDKLRDFLLTYSEV